MKKLTKIELEDRLDRWADPNKSYKCADCNKHKATITFTEGGVLSLSHGMYSLICLCCYVKRIEKGYNDAGKNLKEFRKKLTKDGCK